MPEPIDELSSFDPGGAVTPLPAAEVRRRGDRLRRRNSLMVAGAAVAVALVATPIAVFLGHGDGGKPQPAPPGLTDGLLTADQVPDRQRLTDWREADPEGEVLACAPEPPDSLDPDASVRRDFDADLAEGPPGEIPAAFVRTAVLQFDNPAAARTAYDTATGWIADCAVDESPSREVRSSTFSFADGGEGEWRRHIFPAPEYCGGVECGAALFDRMGVAQSDDRLVLVSLAEVGGPLEPKGLSRTMDELFQAAVAKASGEVVGTPVPPESSDLDGFPLDSGMPDESGNSDDRFDPPSGDIEGMIAAGELTACGNTPPETAPTERLTTRLTGPSDSQIRELQLLPDEQEAVTYVAHLRNLYQSCPTSDSDGGPPTFTTTVTDGAFGEESLDIRSASDGIGRAAITVVRIGSAVLVENVSDEGPGDEVDALATAAHENLADVIAAMNERWGDGESAPDPEETQPQPSTDGPRIPDEFPLAAGWPGEEGLEGPDHGLDGPSRDLPALTFEPCGQAVEETAFADRLLAGWSNAEDYRFRQLTTYADADSAVTAVASLVDAFRECPQTEVDDGDMVTNHDVQRLDVGGESWAILARDTYEGGETPFGATTIVVRLGSAVLILDHGGHAGYPRGNGRAAIDATLTDASTPIAEMCAFTEAGC